jgi:hypothetical protein
MSYGPGYTMWKQILREREERRLARQQAKRATTPPVEPEAPARKRSRSPAEAAETASASNPPASRAARRPTAARGMAASAEAAGRRAARTAAR